MLQTLPGADYHDSAVYEVERERIFHRQWFYAVRADRIAAAGAYVTVDVAGESVLVVRGEDGLVRAFYNVCRHRGSRLCDDDQGSVRRAIKCPYHAWSYGLDGALIGTPNVAPDEIDRATLGLWPVACDVWDGCVFVCLAAEPPALPAPESFERFGLGGLVTGRRTVSEVRANWKILIENYNECLHCPTVHPELVQLIPSYRSGSVVEAGRDDGGVSLANRGVAFTLSGATSLPLLPDLTEADRTAYFGAVVFPNMFIDVTGTSAIVTALLPVAADRTTIVTEYLFRPETVGAPDFDCSDVVDFSELVARQDYVVCERVQRGVSSRAFGHGVYAAKDEALREFNDSYLAVRGPL